MRNAAEMYLQLQKDKRNDQLAANKTIIEQDTSLIGLKKAKSDLSLSLIKLALSWVHPKIHSETCWAISFLWNKAGQGNFMLSVKRHS